MASRHREQRVDVTDWSTRRLLFYAAIPELGRRELRHQREMARLVGDYE